MRRCGGTSRWRPPSIDIPADAPLHLRNKLDFGRYRIEVLEDGGMAATSMRFRSGWVSSDNPDVPDQVDVSADQEGLRARRHRAYPYRAAVRRPGDAAGAVRSRALRSATCRCRRAAPMSTCRYPLTGVPGPMSLCTCSAPRPMRSRGPAAPSAWPGSASILASASCRWRSSVPDKYPPRAARDDQGARRPRRLGQSRGGGRGHPAADELRLARSDRPFPRSPQARPRYPRRLGPADRAARRCGDRAAPGR